MKNYPLFKNPFVFSEFDSGLIVTNGGGRKYTLDFKNGVSSDTPAQDTR
jgi:hypothetical protein